MQAPSLRDTVSFVRGAHAGAGGQLRWLRAMAVVNLLSDVLPGIRVTHEERQVALLRDILRTTRETEDSLLRAGFSPGVVSSVLRLTRFDAGFTYLEHMRAVAGSRDLAAMRVAMAVLLREEQEAVAAGGEPPGVGERRRKAMEMMRRGLGC